MSGAHTEQTEITYLIGGVTYRLEHLSWQQTKWLGEHIFCGVDMTALEYSVIHDLLREKGPLFMAICLLPEGTDRKTHSMQPFRAIEARAQAFAGELSGGEVALFGPHFFRCSRPDQMAMLVEGRVFQRQVDALLQSRAPGANGSSGVSSSSPTAISPSAASSWPSLDPSSQSPRSSVESSDDSVTSPSLASAE